jgi:hypothetical protein
MCDMMHTEGSASVIIQDRSRAMTSRLKESLDVLGDGGTVDSVCLTGVLWARVFSGGGIVDDFTGVDISSAACDFFAFF